MLKNFFKAGFGGAGAQAINFIGLPIIARLYAPEAYATWAILIATAGILGSISCFRYELAIVLQKCNAEASSVFLLCIISASVMGGFAFLIQQLSWVENLMGGQQGDLSLFSSMFFPVMVTAMGVSFALQYWNVRQGAFMINSISQMALALVTLLVQSFYALNVSASATGLLFGSLAGQLALISVCLGSYRYVAYPVVSGMVVKKIPNLAVEHHRFLYYSTPYTLFGVIRSRAALFVLDYFLTSREVGLYAFAYRILNFPLSLFSSALRPVLFKETASLGVKALERKINYILRLLAFLGPPVVVGYFFYAEELFDLFFGEKWMGAGVMGKFIVLPVFTFMFCNWMDRIMDVLGQQRLVLFLEVFFSTSSITGIWLGFVWFSDLYIALSISCAILVIYNICYLFMAYARAGYDKQQLLYLVVILGVMFFLSTIAFRCIL